MKVGVPNSVVQPPANLLKYSCLGFSLESGPIYSLLFAACILLNFVYGFGWNLVPKYLSTYIL
jgi:hypothetical protein